MSTDADNEAARAEATDKRPQTWKELARQLRRQAGRYREHHRRAYLLASAVSWRGMARALERAGEEETFVSDVKGAGEYGSDGTQTLRRMGEKLDELAGRLDSAAEAAEAAGKAGPAAHLLREIRGAERAGERAYNLAGVVASAQSRAEALRSMRGEGRKCYPQDVEAAAESAHAVKELKAFTSDLFDDWGWTETLADRAEALSSEA